MKCLHIISGDLWAGAEVVTYKLIKGLNNLGGLQVTAVFLNESRLFEEVRMLGVPSYAVAESAHSFIYIARKIKSIINEISPDIIHSHRYKENLLAYYASMGTKNPRLIATLHGLPESFYGYNSLKNRLVNQCNYLILKRFDAVVAVSSDIRNSLVNKHGLKESKTWVIKNGVDIPTESSPRLENRNFVIGSAGRLVPVKDYELMVRMAAEIVKQDSNIRFVIAGDGPLREQLRSKIDHLGLSNQFELVGTIDDMNHFYRSLDLYINTSIHEGIPMTVLEAMAHGVPVVACAVGGNKEIIEDGRNGFLVFERDPKLLAEKCLHLKRNDSLWSEISKGARQRVVSNFSDIQMANQYHELYCKRLTDRNKNPVDPL